MFVLSRNGQKDLDVEVTSHGDPTVRVADLDDNRREIMSLSGIPPACLGYADVIELREQLVHTNTSFATEIIDIQQNLSLGTTRVVDIVAEIKKIPIRPSKFSQVSLIPPIVLMLQLIEMTMGSIGNITGVFQTLQLPSDPYFLLQKYMPYIDWETYKKSADKFQGENLIKRDMDASNPDLPPAGQGGM